MWFTYKNIDFDYDERNISEENIRVFFDNIIRLAKKVNIFEICVEEKDFAMIYIEKTEEPDHWDSETMNFVKALENSGYEVLYADEDYGDNLDVLLLYDEINAINALFKRYIEVI